MNTHADKTQENKNQAVSAAVSQMQSGNDSTFQFEDNRPEAVAQRKLQEMANNSPRAMQLQAVQNMAINSPQAQQAKQLQSIADNHATEQQQLIQKKENNTGLPDNLKSGIENLSGMSLDDVKVHRNSDKPAQLQAHAYAQGTDIHLGPGQEKHLPHEAWHVVQQKQGRVKPTMQMKGKVNVNDNASLEKEADVMGAKALQRQSIAKNLSEIKSNTENSNHPVQMIISVAGFQAATPATTFHGRGPNIRALDGDLANYIGARTIANANALVLACNAYLAGNHQAARIAAATAMRTEAQREHQLLTQIGNGNAYLVDALIAQATGHIPSLLLLANQVGAANANTLPNLINTVTPAQIGALVASGAVTAIGAANAHLLVHLIPLANGVAGLANLTALINASGGGANIPLLAPIIPLIGGHAQIATLRAMLTGPPIRTATAAFDMARVAGGNGALFARLCGELPHFQRTAPPGAVPGPVNVARNAYNVARAAAPLAQLNILHVQAYTAYNSALPFTAPPLGTHAGGVNAGLMGNVNARIGTVNGDIAAIGGGAPINAGHRNNANQLRNIVANTLNGQLTGLGGIVVPPAFAPAVLAVTNAFTAFDAANNAPNITNISYDHFLTRHTAHYFDFGEIKPDNTQWPTAWAAGASAQVDARLVALLGVLHGAGNWLMPGIPQPGQAVVGGTAQIAGLLDGGGPGLRLGQFFPEAGANFHDHDAATMRAIDQLV
nr:DUF4157 domain-containing protein [Flavilitoribacter nigricans]